VVHSFTHTASPYDKFVSTSAKSVCQRSHRRSYHLSPLSPTTRSLSHHTVSSLATSSSQLTRLGGEQEAEEAERLAAEREEATRVKKVAMKEDQQQTLAMQMGLKRDVIAREKAAVEKLAEAAMRKEELAAAKEVRFWKMGSGMLASAVAWWGGVGSRERAE
jgi:hypothetical protein